MDTQQLIVHVTPNPFLRLSIPLRCSRLTCCCEILIRFATSCWSYPQTYTISSTSPCFAGKSLSIRRHSDLLNSPRECGHGILSPHCLWWFSNMPSNTRCSRRNRLRFRMDLSTALWITCLHQAISLPTLHSIHTPPFLGDKLISRSPSDEAKFLCLNS